MDCLLRGAWYNVLMSKWQPSPSDYTEVFRSQNPWQVIGTVPLELAPGTYRPLAKTLWQAMIDGKERRHQIILGPRRVGKSTVMYQTVKELLANGIPARRLWWVRLDHPLLMDWPLGQMLQKIIEDSEATPESPAFVFLDELTYASRWDLWLKTFHDERWPVRIVGTSSATAAIRARGSESGVGRWNEHYLAPYLFTEFLDLKQKPADIPCCPTLAETLQDALEQDITMKGLDAFRRRFILTGGFPELLHQSSNATDDASELLRSQRVLRSDAIEKALYKDIPQAFNIQDPSKLERLLYLLGGQFTGQISPHTIASDLQMTAVTVEKYVAFLERAFVVFTLNNYSANEEAVQRRGKRLYFVDGAVRNAALLRGAGPIDQPEEMGMLVENMAASHLRALAYQEGVRLYHWRHKGHEVDLVYDHPDAPMAFEITYAKKHTTAGLVEFQQRFPRFQGRSYLVAQGQKWRAATPSSPGLMPLDLFFVAVGRQEEHAMRVRVGGPTQSRRTGQMLLF